MSVHRFESGSPIHHIELVRSSGGGARAFIHAGSEATQQHIEAMRKLVSEQGWQSVPVYRDGKSCLEIRGCPKIDHLESLLRSGQFISGASVETTPDSKFTLKERFRNNMLWIYGIVNVIADVGFIGYGQIMNKIKPETKNWEDRAAGYAYSAGSLTFFLMARGDESDHQIRDISKKLSAKLRNLGMAIPDDCAIGSFTANPKHGAWGKGVNFLQSHTAEVGNTLTGAAGGFIAMGARKQGSTKDKLLEGSLGFSTLTGGVGAALVKEKPIDPNKPAPTGMGKVWAWVQERPNRLAGFGFMYSTAVHFGQSVSKLTSINKDYAGDARKTKLARWAHSLRLVFTLMNFGGEFLMTKASKGHGHGVKSEKSMDETVYAIVADAIAKQAPEKQEALITELGQHFLTQADVLGVDAALATDTLRQHVRLLDENPWFNSAKTGVSTVAASASHDTHWQRKVSVPQQGQPVAAL